MREPLQPAPPRQIIRNAAWLVAWDEVTQSHVYRRDLDLTIERDTIAAIGEAVPADNADAVEIEGRGFAAYSRLALCRQLRPAEGFDACPGDAGRDAVPELRRVRPAAAPLRWLVPLASPSRQLLAPGAGRGLAGARQPR
jgi:hypothetical protein